MSPEYHRVSLIYPDKSIPFVSHSRILEEDDSNGITTHLISATPRQIYLKSSSSSDDVDVDAEENEGKDGDEDGDEDQTKDHKVIRIGNGGLGPTGLLKELSRVYLTTTSKSEVNQIQWICNHSRYTQIALEAGLIDIGLIYERSMGELAEFEGWSKLGNIICHDHFILVGPVEDPAGLRGLYRDVAEDVNQAQGEETGFAFKNGNWSCSQTPNGRGQSGSESLKQNSEIKNGYLPTSQSNHPEHYSNTSSLASLPLSNNPDSPAKIDRALNLIANAQATFHTRGDGSATTYKEWSLWNSEYVNMSKSYREGEGSGWYKTFKGSPIDAIQNAEIELAYLLTDRATFLTAIRNKLVSKMVVYVQGGKELLNTCFVVTSQRSNENDIGVEIETGSLTGSGSGSGHDYGSSHDYGSGINEVNGITDHSQNRYRSKEQENHNRIVNFTNWLSSVDAQKVVEDFSDPNGRRLFTPAHQPEFDEGE